MIPWSGCISKKPADNAYMERCSRLELAKAPFTVENGPSARCLLLACELCVATVEALALAVVSMHLVDRERATAAAGEVQVAK